MTLQKMGTPDCGETLCFSRRKDAPSALQESQRRQHAVDTGGYHVHSNHRRAQKEQCPEKSGARREVPPFKGDKGGQEKNRGPAMQDFRSDFVANGERETPHEVGGHDEAGVSEIRRIVNAMRDEVKVR